MKLTSILMLAACMQVNAAGYGQRISLSGQKMPLKKVFIEIQRQSGFTFFYSDQDLQHAKKVNIEAKNADLIQVLDQVFIDQPVTYSIIEKIIVVKPKPPVLLAPVINAPKLLVIDVKGRIINESGEPVVGASVTVKGQQQGATTDSKGEFEIKGVNERSVLLISAVNIEPYEISINGRPDLGTISVKSRIVLMEDVSITVNTGLQSIRRERSAGSTAKANMGIVANRSNSPNILQRLDGLVPGLVVNNAPNGEPLLIRGLTSVNSTRGPLIVVDGVEMQNSTGIQNGIGNINPQDVADVTVLKDATAASIWGSKAANGVIVITTKRGTVGEKLRIAYDGYTSFQGRPELDYMQILNSQEFIQTARELFPQYAPNNSWNSVKSIAAVPPHLQIQYNRLRGLITQAREDASLDSLAALDNMSQISDIFYRNAITNNHTISVSGGGRGHTFYGSLNYVGIQSNTPGETKNAYKINLRQDLVVNKRLQFSLVTDLTNRNTRGTNISSVTPSTTLVPYQLFRDGSGAPLAANFFGGYSDSLRLDYQARSRINLDYIPLNEVNNGYSKGSALSVRAIGGVKINLVRGLRFEGTYGYYNASFNERTVLSPNSYTVRQENMRFTQAATVNTIPRYWLPTVGGRLTENNATQKNWTVRNQFLFDRNWNQHQVTLLAGQEATSSTPVATTVIYRGWDDQLQISRPVNYDTLAKGIPATVPGVTSSLPNNLTGGEGVITRTSSFFSNLGYTYREKYVFNASWRIDKSNLFGFDKSAQNKPVWSVGGKWMLGSETFMKSVDWLNKLDVRFTYGITGNSPQPGQSASYDILQAQSNVNYVTGAGVVINTPANDKLTWERTVIHNAGIDFGFFGGRIGGSIDGYIKKTTDLIGPLNTPPLTGYASVVGNLGDLENKGIDISLTSINLNSKDFLWTTVFTLGYNKNKITKLAAIIPITTGPQMIGSRYLVGYPAFSVFAYNYAGLNDVGDPQFTKSDKTVTAAATVSKAEDVLYMGTSQPTTSGGLFNTFMYKDFQLGINITYNTGYVLFRDVNTFWGDVMYYNTIHPEFLNRWKVPGDENKTNIPRYASTNAISSNRNTTYYSRGNINVFDASYAKIREITLSYSLPQSIIQNIKAQEVSFRFQVTNLMLWKANDFGIDPEFHSFNGVRSLRQGQGAVTIGAHITF